MSENAFLRMQASVMRKGPGREFSFTADDFGRIRQMIFDHAGICLSNTKQDMVYNRLAPRLRETRTESFSEYLERLSGGDNKEWEKFVNSLTTNLTSFFREPHHFPILGGHLRKLGKHQPRQIRIWCCAASTGEEPYSIAMTAVETFGSFDVPVSIIASDLDTQVLEIAAKGTYTLEQTERLSRGRLRRFFVKNTDEQGDDSFTVRTELQRLISFERQNLLEFPWQVEGSLDAIFCRNVMIYFDKPTQYKILTRFAPLMNDNALLFAGHSESFLHTADLFHLQGKTVYELTDKGRLFGGQPAE